MERDVYGGGYVPRLLLTVGFFLASESLTYTAVGLRSPKAHVDLLDFAFVFCGAVLISVVGIIEGRREPPDSVCIFVQLALKDTETRKAFRRAGFPCVLMAPRAGLEPATF